MDTTIQRDASIDIAKGIGIILVVFGHTFQIYSVTNYVYAFHMPLFFLLSGYTFNVQKHLQDKWGFLRKNLLRLMIPYFGVAILSYILYVYTAPILSLPEITANNAAFGILSGNGINLPFNDVLWFLPAFFFAGLIFLGLTSMFNDMKLCIGMMLVSISGIIIGSYTQLPFGLDIAMTTQFFIYCGHLFRNTDWLENRKKSKTTGILIASAATLTVLVLGTLNGRVDLMTRVYGDPAMFFLAGLSGSVLVLMTSLFFSTYFGKILQITGRASMYVFMSHVPIAYGLAYIAALLWGFWIYYTFETYWYLLFIIGLCVPTIVYLLVTSISHRGNSPERHSLLQGPIKSDFVERI